MSDEEIFKFPIEIPWKLAATTHSITTAESGETSISMFYFLPQDQEIESHYPDQQIIYLKFTISVSPAAFPATIPSTALLGEGVPCFHLRLDTKVRLTGETTDEIVPYFHAAAPLRREMLQTGIIGVEDYEGEAESQFMGKSGSQMYETFRSNSTTNSGRGGTSIGVPGVGSIDFSAGTTSTSVSANRSVTQFVDATQRQASEERRELVSHTTRVENILTLLSAKYVGTPHLSFSMSPRPLTFLSIDPSDPNLWFSQLLVRRSIGIEGIQEFTVALMIPRGKDFCVEAQLRRVCVLDDPPGPFALDEKFNINNPYHVDRMTNYLERTYPNGTPIDDLDVNLRELLIPSAAFIRPVVYQWGFDSERPFVFAFVVSPPKKFDAPYTEWPGQNVNYKHSVEVWLDALIDEYEREVARSPIERGLLISEDRQLETCFSLTENGDLAVSGSTTSVSPPVIVDLDPPDADLGGIRPPFGSVGLRTRENAYAAITRWNLLDHRLAAMLANGYNRGREFRLDDQRVLGIVLRRWAKLAPKDPRNLGLNAASEFLDLKESQRKRLKGAGVTDLRGLASILLYGSAVEQYNQRLESLRTEFSLRHIESSLPTPLPVRLSSRERDALIRHIGSVLHATFTPRETKES